MSTARTRVLPRQPTAGDAADSTGTTAAPAGPPLPGLRDSVDRPALGLWLWTRLSVFLLVGVGAWLLNANPATHRPIPYTHRWVQWDTYHYLTIAHFGYSGDPLHKPWVPLEAFFPGYPMALRFGHTVTGLPLVEVGLLISLVAGAVATVALARIALDYAPPGAGAPLAQRTVLIFLIAPTTVFLSAAYTESLFLALALPAWLAARRGQWGRAGLLAAAASAVRLNGAFLALALIVEFLTHRDSARGRWTWANLIVPFLPFIGYMTWLHQRTGDWMYWHHAEERGWGRHTVWPWQGLHSAWAGRFDGQIRTDFAWMYLLEIITVSIGVALTVWLARHRRWAETTYIGLQVASLLTTSLWQSCPRYALIWWPLWVVLAGWTLRRPAVFRAVLVVFAPLAVTFTLMFSTGRWVG